MPQLLVVHPSVKATTLKELLALAKARPGELNYSSSGTGSSSHLAMELLKYMAGINVVHVPFKGSGQAMPSLLAGQVQLVFDPMPSSLPHVKSGRLRAIAISTATRSPAIPELPTVAEAGVRRLREQPVVRRAGAGAHAARHRCPVERRPSSPYCAKRT